MRSGVIVVLALCLLMPRFARAAEQEAGGAAAKYEAAIEQNRRGRLTIAVVDAEGSPLQGMRVRWRLAERAFRFGYFEEPYNPALEDGMREAGCDFVTMHFNWLLTEPQDGVFPWAEIDLRTNAQARHAAGLLVKAHALVWLTDWFTPDYLDDLGFVELKTEVEQHARRVVRHYRDHVDIWNVINEPSADWANEFGLTNAQIIELIEVTAAVVRKDDPTARIIINNAAPAAAFYDHQQYPLDFLRECEAAGVDYNIVGLQCYYSPLAARPGENPITLDDLSDMVDAYSELGREIHITELSVPSTGGGWTPAKQAAWLEDAYTMFFSKPQVGAITWWNATDRHSFIADGGLIYETGLPKKSFHRLRRLLTRRWYTRGKAVTDAAGLVSYRGFGGTYDVTVADTASGLSTSTTLQLDEGAERTATVVFNPDQIEAERAASDKKLKKKINKRLAWLEDLIDYRDGQGDAALAEQGRLGVDAVESLVERGKLERALRRVERLLDTLAVARTTVLRALDMEPDGGSGINLWGDYAALYSKAALVTSMTLSSRGATVTVRAAGDFAAGVAPLFVLSLGDSHSGEIFLTSEGWRDYSFELEYEPGRCQLRLLFLNDFYQRGAGADRNLYLDTITVVEKSWQAPQ